MNGSSSSSVPENERGGGEMSIVEKFDQQRHSSTQPTKPPKPSKWFPLNEIDAQPLAGSPRFSRPITKISDHGDDLEQYGQYESPRSPNTAYGRILATTHAITAVITTKARTIKEALLSSSDPVMETVATSTTDSAYHSAHLSASIPAPVKPPKPKSLTNHVAFDISAGVRDGSFKDEESKFPEVPTIDGTNISLFSSSTPVLVKTNVNDDDFAADVLPYVFDDDEDALNEARLQQFFSSSETNPKRISGKHSSLSDSSSRTIKSIQEKALKARNATLTRLQSVQLSQQFRELLASNRDIEQQLRGEEQASQQSPIQRMRASLARRTNRAESSFAIWQVNRSRAKLRKGIFWDGDQKYPYFCYMVMAVTGIILFAEIANNGFQIDNFANNPTFGPSKRVLIDMGAKRTDLILGGEFHRLIAAWWLHGGILHWIINMVALRNLGFGMEREFGSPKIALIYCWAGFAGVLTSCVFLPNVVGVGASGAIFGLFGASWSDLIQNFELYKTRKEEKRMLRQLVLGTIVNVLLGLIPIIDQFAHMGGLVNGMFLGFCLLLQTRYTRQGVQKEFRRRNIRLRLFGLLVAILGPMLLLIVLYQQVDPKAHWCEWCERVNCAPLDALWFCDASGCSDDGNVRGGQFPNGTILVNCPSFVDTPTVMQAFSQKASSTDVINVCRAGCFPP